MSWPRCLLLLSLGLALGCWSSRGPQVIVYSALDQEFAEPILRDYQSTHQVQIAAKYDVESTKTIGLTQAILAERNRPRCDLFWNNEILNSIRLDRAGLLRPLPDDVLNDYPRQFQAPNGNWCGLAARARVILVNKNRMPDREQWPTSVMDLGHVRYLGRAAWAKPLFGTTAAHATVIYHTLGREAAKEFFEGVYHYALTLSGNKQVAVGVGSGQLYWGLTDTDDALAEIRAGRPVEIVYPDQAEGSPGTLFIPNTICLIKGSPHPKEADHLARQLLSGDVENRLATGPSGQIPLHPNSDAQPPVETPKSIRAMDVDFTAAAEDWDATALLLREVFYRRGP